MKYSVKLEANGFAFDHMCLDFFEVCVINGDFATLETVNALDKSLSGYVKSAVNIALVPGKHLTIRYGLGDMPVVETTRDVLTCVNHLHDEVESLINPVLRDYNLTSVISAVG